MSLDRRGRQRRRLLLGASLAMIGGLLVVPGVLVAPARADSAAVTPGQWFAFDYDIYLDNGVGNYSGYTEQTLEHYRYHVVSVVGSNVTLFGSGNWQFSNNSGGSGSGSWSETFSYSSATRLYLWGFDVFGNYSKPAIWFWVPTPLANGQVLPILDDNFTVRAQSTDVWGGLPPIPRQGIQLETTGSFVRTDSYGNFNANWDDTYWFAPSSGFVLAETYVEQDSNSAGDGFRWRELATVTSASYLIPYDWAALLAVYAGIPATVAGALVSIRWYHRGPRHVRPTPPRTGPSVTVRRVRNVTKYLALPTATASPYGPFLPLIVRRARQRKCPVWVATDGTRLVGVMVREREARVSALFTSDPAIAKLFRSMNRSRGFFAELPPSAWVPPAQSVDRFSVLTLSPVPAPTSADPSVRPMRPEDLAAVLVLAKAVYTIPEPKWLRQAFDDGDLGFTAWDGSELVGFAFATVAGDDAILHTLTVDRRYRGQGYGHALMAARLSALAALGVQRALVEISVRNVASLAVARAFGFAKIGETTYYSRKPKRAVPVDRRPF
ncbi:MAG: GNAT family N-acetyltransferase [Thermoplasmata archaeon]|nr:GNAT family N-acetyltransferase [Thermoplasmata archaeon]MCI4356141.1 GNAT family N-acetyltransferase [Thermoplasmata archaeon]